MKRFFCAVILLAVIFISSFYMNFRIRNFASEFTDVVNRSEEPMQIQQYWAQNEKFVLMLLPHNQTEAISAIINTLPDYKAASEEYYNIRKAELLSQLELIGESMKLSGANIF